MRGLRGLFARGLTVAILACCVGSLTGCIVIETNDSNSGEVRRHVSKIWPRREGKDDIDNERLSLKGTATEFGRGLTNVAFCWVEIPYELEEGVRGNTEPGLGGLIGTAWGLTTGAVQGAFGTVGRAAGGVIEIALSPFPPHGPLMRPAAPPYLNFKRKSPEPEHLRNEEVESPEIDIEELPGVERDAA